MFSFSTKTQVNKELKIRDVLRQIGADKDIKTEAQSIKSLSLTNILNENTINCERDEKYKEIYLFLIDMKDRIIPQLFITELDKSIKLHTFFIIRYEDEIATAMAFKSVTSKVTVGKYELRDFRIDKLVEIPSFHNIPEAYKYLMAYQNQVDKRREETPEEFQVRINAIHRLQFQISKTTVAIKAEVQPKKKYVYNTRLNEYKTELDSLLRGD